MGRLTDHSERSPGAMFIFSPAITLMNRLDVTKKFLVLGLMSLIAIVVVVYNLYINLDGVIRTSQRELEGIALVKSISQSLQTVQLHRGLSSLLLGGDITIKDKRATRAIDVAEKLKAIDIKLPFELASSKNWSRIKVDWEHIIKDGHNLTINENYTAHTRLIELIRLFEVTIADEYWLTLDPVLDTYYLIDSSIQKFPNALERLGQIRAYGAGILVNKRITDPQKDDIKAMIAQLGPEIDGLENNLAKVARQNPVIRENIFIASKNISNSVQQITTLVTTNILVSNLTMTPQEYVEKATLAIDKGYEQLYDSLLPMSADLLRARISQAEKKLYISVGIAFLLFLVVIYFSVGIVYSVITSIRSLASSAKSFAGGNFNERIQLDGNDELSFLGDSFNEMADGFNALIDARKKNEDQLQNMNEELERRVEQRTYDLKTALDEAERANLAKSEFLSSMSHELRTPMNAILGYSQLMQMDEDFPVGHKENVDHMLSAGYHLLDLIDDVLDLAKIESGKIDLQISTIEVGNVIEECVKLIQPLAEKFKIKITHSALQDVKVQGDRRRLKQVLINIMSNGIKYNHPNGSLHIEISPHGIDHIRIFVKDTGKGIPKERLNELFEPFNRLGAESGNIEGTGIGLTIARQIVEAMGGVLNVESVVGLGSTFWIELPLTQA